MSLTRRGFIGASAGLAAFPRLSWAANPGIQLETRVLEVLGRAATVYGITGPEGRSGIWAREGDRFPTTMTNATQGPQVMHFHGQIHAPWMQDRARPGGGALAVGAMDRFDFPLTPGTHWMHSHDLAEQQLLAAPVVTARAEEVEPEATVILHDFSFTPPGELLDGLLNSTMGGMLGMRMGGMDMGKMDMSSMADHDMAGMAMMGMSHANDITYDAFLANDRTLDDPEVIAVSPGLFRLRIINAATSTAFWLDTGSLAARIVAVDGNPVVPLAANPVPLAMGQRLDLMLTIPASGGAFPILAQVETTTRRTGVILATAGAAVARIPSDADVEVPEVDLSLEARLRAPTPLADRPATAMELTLGMAPGYRWTINGAAMDESPPLAAFQDSRVEIAFLNPSMMMHPMHLHGHHFQVVDLGQGRFSGALRDVIIVPPMANVTVAVDFVNPGDWFLHCHNLYHMAAGMMTTVQVRPPGAGLESYQEPAAPQSN